MALQEQNIQQGEVAYKSKEEAQSHLEQFQLRI